MAATVYEHKQDDYNTQDGYNMQQYKVSFSYYNVLLLYYMLFGPCIYMYSYQKPFPTVSKKSFLN